MPIVCSIGNIKKRLRMLKCRELHQELVSSSVVKVKLVDLLSAQMCLETFMLLHRGNFLPPEIVSRRNAKRFLRKSKREYFVHIIKKYIFFLLLVSLRKQFYVKNLSLHKNFLNIC